MGGCASSLLSPRQEVRHKFPKRIVIVRHGQSQGNVDETEYSRTADWQIGLTEEGIRQARACGEALRQVVGPNGKLFVYCSPYKRCKQTLGEVLSVSGYVEGEACHVREEPRLREQDFGNFQDAAGMVESKRLRLLYGRFFYRFPNGESGADVYDRVSTWLESLFREIEHGTRIDPDTTVVLCTHGLTGRLFLMRWYHWDVDQWEQTMNPPNAQLLVMERRADANAPHDPWSRHGYRHSYELTETSRKLVGLHRGGGSQLIRESSEWSIPSRAGGPPTAADPNASNVV